MANIKTYDILQCSRLFPTVNGANNVAFLPFIDDIVTINSDSKQSYTVKENVQGRFFAPTSADAISNVQYSVTSILFNGLECLSAPANLTVEFADNIYIEFLLYGADPNGYDSNVAKAVIATQSMIGTSFFERNFVDFMQGLFTSLSIPVDVVNSHDAWWVADGFQSMRNFMMEMYSSDTLSVTITETYNTVVRELKYVLDGTTATAFIGGNDVTVIPVPANEQPQFGDEYSINSFSVTASPIVEVDCCPVVDPFYASLRNDCCSTLDSDCDCSSLSFTDTSAYDNGLLGHDPSYFNHRTISLTRPDGTQYIWSTDGVVGQPVAVCNGMPVVSATNVVNQIIAPHWNSNNMFSYNFTDSDQDGLYTVDICTYPDWQAGIYYDDSLNYFVYQGGIIYRQVASSTGVDPSTDTDNDFWIPALADDDRGRYCSEEKIVILCISILDCYKSKVETALCDIKFNPCKSMCDNPALMAAIKMRVTMDAVEFAVCAKQWDLAKDHISILKSICCCNG
jgi:hypothetical protein